MNTENIAITNAAWEAVTFNLPDTVTAYTVKSRSGSSFLMSSNADGSDYFTVTGVLTVENVRVADTVAFYAKSSVANDTLELLLFI